MLSFFYSGLAALLATRQAVMAGLRQTASRRGWIGESFRVRKAVKGSRSQETRRRAPPPS
jgi:hypothetical protein